MITTMAIRVFRRHKPPQGGKFHSGKRPDIRDGLFLRSKMEANFARVLEFWKSQGVISGWTYESEEFEFPVKRGQRFYKPDFIVTENHGGKTYYEIKGGMDSKSNTKLKRMKKYYPDIKLRVIDEKEMRIISQNIKGHIEKWEH